MGLKRVSWVRRYQGQCRALRPLGHQGYRLRNHKNDQPLCSGYMAVIVYISIFPKLWFICVHMPISGLSSLVQFLYMPATVGRPVC